MIFVFRIKAIVRSGNSINTTSTFSRSGFFLKKRWLQNDFQNAIQFQVAEQF
jgi:hypothetical protein